VFKIPTFLVRTRTDAVGTLPDSTYFPKSRKKFFLCTVRQNLARYPTYVHEHPKFLHYFPTPILCLCYIIRCYDFSTVQAELLTKTEVGYWRMHFNMMHFLSVCSCLGVADSSYF